ncbi:allophanate hydrolase subunit 1 [Paracoccus sp. M683]|uniref:5-oxoprolinase subunit B family protein n=1 Tax=Paracoccus sp. M683 TaxID=2594268 RepID=UPI00163D558F|nr:carboxyltransferase domain-containing protein [Paracoccus sp. M683]
MPDDMPILVPEALPAGLDGVVIRFSLNPEPRAMAAAQLLAADLAGDAPQGVTEIAPGLVSVLMRFDAAIIARAALMRDALTRAQAVAAHPRALPAPARRWTIPAAFGGEHGPQLGQIARAIDLSEQAAVDQLCQADLRVLAIGYAPGQPYIGLLPEPWNLPRMSELNPMVPAGAVVSAVRQLVMFTAASATGWRQIARTGFRAFDPDRQDPMPLRAGDAIRYAAVAADQLDGLMARDDGLGGARLEVLG